MAKKLTVLAVDCLPDPIFGDGGFTAVAEGSRLAIWLIICIDLLDVLGIINVCIDFGLANLSKEVSFIALPPLVGFGRQCRKICDALSRGSLMAPLFSCMV